MKILKISLLFLIYIFSKVDAKIDCNKHPIFCQILENKNRIDRSYAMELSNSIYKVSRKYRIPPHIYTAILMQESSYVLDAKGCYHGLIKLKKEAKVCTDFGISQIWYKTAKAFQFEISKLVSDLDYSVEAGAIVLADFKKRYAKSEEDWWTRYNSSIRSKRDIYKKLVERYM